MGSGDAVGKQGIFLKPTIILCRPLSEHPQCAAGAPRCAKYIVRATMTDFAMPETRYAQRRHQYHLFRRWGMVRSIAHGAASLAAPLLENQGGVS
jgi:hypothetical protein